MALESPVLSHLFDAMRDLHSWMEDQYVEYAVVGDAAMTLLWKPRVTFELEVLADAREMTLARLTESAGESGYHLLADESDSKNTLVFEHGPSTVRLRLRLPQGEFERAAVSYPMLVNLEDFIIKLPVPEDFLLLSAAWKSGPDWEDVASMLANFPALDRNYLLGAVREHAADPRLSRGMERIERALLSLEPDRCLNGTHG